jgi:xanthine/uracil permease
MARHDTSDHQPDRIGAATAVVIGLVAALVGLNVIPGAIEAALSPGLDSWPWRRPSVFVTGLSGLILTVVLARKVWQREHIGKLLLALVGIYVGLVVVAILALFAG